MRVFLLAGMLLCAASPLLAVTIDLSPPPKVLPPAAPPPKAEVKANCPRDCPKTQATEHQAHVIKRHPYSGVSYHYAAAAPFQATWPAASQPADPQPAAPQSTIYEQGLTIDNGGWSGGVGYAPEGGGGGGFVDGYGQVHFPTDAGNGPTYNSYNQSFQFNPSQPGPFQPRLMGGFAPSSAGSR